MVGSLRFRKPNTSTAHWAFISFVSAVELNDDELLEHVDAVTQSGSNGPVPERVALRSRLWNHDCCS